MSDVPPGPAGPDQPDRGEPDAHRPGRDAGFQQHARAARSEFEQHVAQARDQFEQHVAQARDQFEETNERIKQRTGRDLVLAILIGIAIGAVVLASLIFVKWLFAVLTLGVAVLGLFELTRALQAGGRRVDLVPQLGAGALVVASGYFAQMWLHWIVLFAAIAVVVVWRLLAQMVTRDSRLYADVAADVVVGALLPVYVPFLASLALVLLRQDGGEWWVLSFLAIVVVADTAAYATGLAFGKHPMAPRISPKKTWEGFAGAAVASLAAGALLAHLALGAPWWSGLIFGAAILLTATIGDLGESMLKRDLGIKDMSSWLPGHGGVLDRLDSILPSTTAALTLYILLTPLVVR